MKKLNTKHIAKILFGVLMLNSCVCYADNSIQTECLNNISSINKNSNELIANQIKLVKVFSGSDWMPKDKFEQFNNYILDNKNFAVKLNNVVNLYYNNKDFKSCVSPEVSYSNERVRVMANIANADIQTIESVNHDKIKIIKENKCKNEVNCRSILFDVYQKRLEIKLKTYQSEINTLYDNSFSSKLKKEHIK